MEMIVNTSGVPVNTTKPKLYGRIVGGTETDITSHPYQVCSLVAVQFDDTLKYLNKRDRLSLQ